MSETNKAISKHFWCYECSRYWYTEDFQIEEGNEDHADEFGYESRCPECGNYTRAVKHYYANLSKMHSNASGPKTREGKERAKMNGYKHGLYTTGNHLLAPANHGRCNQSDTCPDSEACKEKQIQYCPHQLELLLRFIHAYESKDHQDLKEFAGLAQGKTMLVLLEMFRELAERGVLIESMIGDSIEMKDNPVLRRLPEIMKVLGFSADQQKMTPEKENDGDSEAKDVKQAPKEDFLESLRQSINVASAVVTLADEMRAKDALYQKSADDENEELEVEIDLPDRNVFSGRQNSAGNK